MARTDQTLMDKRAFAERMLAPMVNPGEGGQNAHHSNFRYYLANAHYVRRNIIPVVIEIPRGFSLLDDYPLYVNSIKGLFETHARMIDGLKNTLTVDTQGIPVSGDGNEQEEFTNVTRERTTPTFTFNELYGTPINALLEFWITMFMADPISKVPGICTRLNRPADLLPDFYSMTMLFIEPDPTYTKVQRAWLCTNMFPKTAGQVEGSRDPTIVGQTVEYTIEFTALTQCNYGTIQFAQGIFDTMNMQGVNPHFQPAFVDGIDTDVAASDVGFMDKVNTASGTWPQP